MDAAKIVHNTFMRAEDKWDDFKRRLDVAPPKRGANLQFSFMADVPKE